MQSSSEQSSSEQRNTDREVRLVKAVHGLSQIEADQAFEIGLAEHLRAEYSRSELLELYGRFMTSSDRFNVLMRRAIWHALTRRCGHNLQIDSQVAIRHPETFEIGDSVSIGTQACIQGRFDGRCQIGNHVWIGPQSFLDARDLIIGDYVGWGPGAKVLGSAHTGIPVDQPVIQTDLEIKTVRIEDWVDIGTNAVILPGVCIGKGSIVGAGSVVNRDVPPFAVVAGVPARILRWRRETDTERERACKIVEF